MKESLKVPKEHPKPRVRLLDQRDYETLESYDSRCRFVIFCRLPFRSKPSFTRDESLTEWSRRGSLALPVDDDEDSSGRWGGGGVAWASFRGILPFF